MLIKKNGIKIVSILTIGAIVFIPTSGTFAIGHEKNNEISNEYTYFEYNNPIEVENNGVKEVLLGYYESNSSTDPNSKVQRSSYREYDRWYVYDRGITKTWSYLSKPYFIKSIARGMTYEKTTEFSTTVGASIDGNIPTGAKDAIKKAFGLNASATKKVTVKVTLSGPDKGYSSREFYYRKGRHTHDVKIVQEHRNNWDGVLWKKTHYAKVGEPAIKNYSVDKK